MRDGKVETTGMGDDTDTYKHRRQGACNVSVRCGVVTGVVTITHPLFFQQVRYL